MIQTVYTEINLHIYLIQGYLRGINLLHGQHNPILSLLKAISLHKHEQQASIVMRMMLLMYLATKFFSYQYQAN